MSRGKLSAEASYVIHGEKDIQAAGTASTTEPRREPGMLRNGKGVSCWQSARKELS